MDLLIGMLVRLFVIFIKNDYGNTTLALRTGHHNQDDVLNSLLAAGDAIKANWRASQWEILTRF